MLLDYWKGIMSILECTENMNWIEETNFLSFSISCHVNCFVVNGDCIANSEFFNSFYAVAIAIHEQRLLTCDNAIISYCMHTNALKCMCKRVCRWHIEPILISVASVLHGRTSLLFHAACYWYCTGRCYRMAVCVRCGHVIATLVLASTCVLWIELWHRQRNKLNFPNRNRRCCVCVVVMANTTTCDCISITMCTVKCATCTTPHIGTHPLCSLCRVHTQGTWRGLPFFNENTLRIAALFIMQIEFNYTISNSSIKMLFPLPPNALSGDGAAASGVDSALATQKASQ